MSDVCCRDCGLPYCEWGLDFVLPDQQWRAIHPEGEGGILCANCIGKRAEKLGGTVVMCWVDRIDYALAAKAREALKR